LVDVWFLQFSHIFVYVYQYNKSHIFVYVYQYNQTVHTARRNTHSITLFTNVYGSVTNQLRCVGDGSNPDNSNKILKQISRFCTRRRRFPDACGLSQIFLGIATPVAVPNFELKIVRLLARFLPILGIPDTISDDLRCPPINRRRAPNNLRLVARFYVGLQIQVKIQCLLVVSGDLRLKRRRPATTHTLSVIFSDESYGGIVVNRCVYKGASDRIAKSLRRSYCRRL